MLSKDAVGGFLNELGEGDRFELMTLNVKPNLVFTRTSDALPYHRLRMRRLLGRAAWHLISGLREVKIDPFNSAKQ